MGNVSVKVNIDQKGLEHAVNFAQGTGKAISKESSKIAKRANAMSSGYRTPIWHDHKTGETKGGKAPDYHSDVKLGRNGYVGIVYTANYAAMKDNHQHNTLLKAKG